VTKIGYAKFVAYTITHRRFRINKRNYYDIT